MPGEDYTALGVILTFMPGDTVQCVEVNITDDTTLEPLEEYFIIQLECGPNLDFRIQINDTIANVTIFDDDGAF